MHLASRLNVHLCVVCGAYCVASIVPWSIVRFATNVLEAPDPRWYTLHNTQRRTSPSASFVRPFIQMQSTAAEDAEETPVVGGDGEVTTARLHFWAKGL